MELDDKVCYCFHVSRRSLENFALCVAAEGAEPDVAVRRGRHRVRLGASRS